MPKIAKSLASILLVILREISRHILCNAKALSSAFRKLKKKFLVLNAITEFELKLSMEI